MRTKKSQLEICWSLFANKDMKIYDKNERDSLRMYICHLVRCWAALDEIKYDSQEITSVFKDLCSDKLRIMLYELENRKFKNMVGFSLKDKKIFDFTEQKKNRYEKYFKKLGNVNKWFAAGATKGLHPRNALGAHLQSLNVPMNMFQNFGYGGEREKKYLTIGVVSCIKLMKILDRDKRGKKYCDLKNRIRGKKNVGISKGEWSAKGEFGLNQYMRENRFQKGVDKK